MVSHTVSNDIPPPEGAGQKGLRGSPVISVIRSLKPGQSAWFAGQTTQGLLERTYRLKRSGERPAAKWCTRKEGNGTRIWCLSDPLA